MAKEYIERETAAKAFDELLKSPYADAKKGIVYVGTRDALKLARDMMRNEVPRSLSIPAANVRENVPAHWYDVGSLSCRCSACGSKNNRETPFCPICGAQMGGTDGPLKRHLIHQSEEIVMNNADALRAMSDEELADKLWSIAHYEQKKRCISDWLDWLKQEVDE